MSYNGLLDGHMYQYDLCWIVKQIQNLKNVTGSLEKAWKEFKTEFGDNLEQTVLNQLETWLNDGTLENLIALSAHTIVYLNPINYGAVPNDEDFDSTPAFIECFNDARDKGISVYIPATRFYLKNSIDLPANVSILGSNKNNAVLVLGGYFRLNGFNTIQNVQFQFQGALGVEVANNGCLINNCYFYNGSMNTEIVMVTISHNGTISNCIFENYGTGILARGGDNSINIFKCILNNEHSPLFINSGIAINVVETAATTIRYCDILKNNYGVMLTSLNAAVFSCEISDCFIDQNLTGISQLGSADISRLTVTDTWIATNSENGKGVVLFHGNGIIFDGCNFINTYTSIIEDAINLQSIYNSIIRNCTFQFFNAAITLNNCHDILIQNNNLQKWSQDTNLTLTGINVPVASEFKIAGNVFPQYKIEGAGASSSNIMALENFNYTP